MEPYIKEMQLTTLLPGSIDESIAVIFSGPFKKYYTMLTEVSPHYWDALRYQPDCREFPEVAALRRYKGVIRSEWRSLYKNRRKIDATA